MNMQINSKVNGLFDYSELESARFKANVYRGYLEQISARQIIDFVNEKNADFIFFRVSSDNLDQLFQLDRTPFPYLVADTLLYYSCDLDKTDSKPLRNEDLLFEKADQGDTALLENMVAEIFAGYKNHYFSNPFLDKESILDGYKEWVLNFLHDKSSKLVFKASRAGEVIAFATCSFDESAGSCEGVLYGVLPQCAGGGVYTDLIRYSRNYFKEHGYSLMKVSTQAHNFAVQKAWVRENFFLSEAYNTIHINSLFSQSVLEKERFPLVFKEEDLEKAISFSGDDNKLHLSDEFARARGFAAKIAHGMLLNAVTSRHFGKVNPGDGTIFLNYNYYFYQPIYLNQQYYIEISYPRYQQDSQKYLALIKVLDQDDHLCAVSYNNLLKK